MTDVINGLVLIGGQSKRMGRDKAFLEYRGTSQLDAAVRLLEGYCRQAFISKRADQDVPAPFTNAVIDDVSDVRGPLAGILSAFTRQDDCAWFVLACDLPFFDEKAVRYLLDHRQSGYLATAYRSKHTGDPDPLCAIYEPEMAAVLREAAARGYSCPRRILKEQKMILLDPVDPRWLENVNTPEERKQALNRKGQIRGE